MPKTTTPLLTEDFYKTAISAPLAATWDIILNVTTPPVNKKWFIIVDPASQANREKMYYHDVIGNLIYVKWVNRVNPKAHIIWDTVQINDTSLVFNYLSRLNSTTFFIEQLTSLWINVFWWPVLYWIKTVSVADTPLTMINGATNFIYYKATTNTINSAISESVVTADKWIVVAEVVTASWIITSINYRQHKFSIWASIDTVILTNTVWLVDTYTITYSDWNTSTFDVTNWSSIASILKTWTTGDIDTYTVTLTNWNTSTFTVTNWSSISTILKTSTVSNIDTYTITLTNWNTSTFDVTNWFVALSEKIITQSATPTYNTDWARAIIITWLAQDITSMTSWLTWTPNSWDMFRMQLQDDGVSRNIFWWAAFENTWTTLPLTTIAWTRMDLVFIYNATTSKWRCVWLSWAWKLPTYTITNVTTDRILDTNATTVAELANVLWTLIADIEIASRWPQWLTWNWIQSIALTSTTWLVDTYTITFTDSTTFNYDIANWKSIASHVLTSTVWLVKTYTITYNDGSTFVYTVTDWINWTWIVNSIVWWTWISIDNTDPKNPIVNSLVSVPTVTSVTANYTILPTDDIILWDISLWNIDLTLPTATSWKKYNIKASNIGSFLEWYTTWASKPTAWWDPATAAVWTKIYMIWGSNSAWTVVNVNEIYDTATNTWSSWAVCPYNIQYTDWIAVWTWIYVIGWADWVTAWITNNYYYDTVANTWTAKTPCSVWTYWAWQVYYNWKIYVISWRNTTEITTNQIYDVATNSWTTWAAAPLWRWHTRAVEYNGKIYLLAWYKSWVADNRLDIYAPVANTWWTTLAVHPFAWWWMAVTVFNKKIYTFWVTNNTAQVNAYSYDFSTNTWTAIQSLPSRLAHTKATLVNNKIYIIWGYQAPTTPSWTGVNYIYAPAYNNSLNIIWTIDWVINKTLSINKEAIEIVWDGTNWNIINKYL